MSMSGTPPNRAEVTTTVDETAYANLCKTIAYAVKMQTPLTRSFVVRNTIKIMCSFEAASIENPTGNDRAIYGPAQFVGDLETSGFNGLDTSTKAVSSTYYIWLVGHDSNGDLIADQCGLLFSLSNSSPTMPTVNGTTLNYKRLISVCFTDSNGYIVPFIHDGDFYSYGIKRLVQAISSGGSTTVDLNDFTPAGCRVADIKVEVVSSSGTATISIRTHHDVELLPMIVRAAHSSSAQIRMPDILDSTDRKIIINATLTTATINVYIDGFLMRYQEP